MIGKICCTVFLGCLLLLSTEGKAQFPSNRPLTTSPDGRPTDAGGIFGNPSGFDSDTLGIDSAAIAALNIPPDTRYVDREALFSHREPLVAVSKSLEASLYFDPLEAVPGFVRSLGQIGKPYQAYLHGLEESYHEEPLWRDPLFNRYDRYSLDASRQVPYYDTKTPYIDLTFRQGQRQLQVVDATLARSFGPSIHLSGYLRRPQSVGAYRNFVTDHTLAYLAGYYRSPGERYHAFGNLTLNRHNDQLHGGTPRASNDALYPVVNGLIRENPAAANLTFFKENFPPHLDASLRKKNTAIYFDQYYHLIGDSDSAENTIKKKHKISLRNSIQYDWQTRSFFDAIIDTNRLQANLVPVLPTLAADSNSISDSIALRRFQALGAISYSWMLSSGWQANLSGGLNFQRILVRREDFALVQNITEQFGKISLRFPGGSLTGDIRQRISTLFSPEQKLNATLLLSPFSQKDSAGKITQPGPISFLANGIFGNLNPSLFQGHVPGIGGNAFLPNSELRNEQLVFLRAQLHWQPAAPIREQDTLLPHFATLGASWSTKQNAILYTPQFEVIQSSQTLTRGVVNVDARLRFFRHFHLENHAEWTPRIFRSDDETLDLYLRSIPEYRGKASLYFDHRGLSIAREFRLGLGMNWWTGYAGQTLEPISGEFFPTNYQVLPFAAGEAFFQLNIHGVYLFFRYLYLNENLLYNGYYSTPFYPMMERSYLFGINWTFYD